MGQRDRVRSRTFLHDGTVSHEFQKTSPETDHAPRYYADLFLYKGRDGVFNPNVCDAKKISTYRPYGSRGGVCLGYTPYAMGDPRYSATDTKLVQFVTIGVVSQSSVLGAHENRRSKFLRAFLPSYTTDRVQGLIRVGLRQMSADVRSQISVMGFEFTTRSKLILFVSITWSHERTSVQSDFSRPTSPQKPSRRSKPAIFRGEKPPDTSYVLGFDEDSELDVLALIVHADVQQFPDTTAARNSWTWPALDRIAICRS